MPKFKRSGVARMELPDRAARRNVVIKVRLPSYGVAGQDYIRTIPNVDRRIMGWANGNLVISDKMVGPHVITFRGGRARIVVRGSD